jgi:hypothetical protein
MNRPVALICPLNWGLGHAARCIPLIHRFLEHGFRVVAAAENPSLSLLSKEFGNRIDYVIFPGINIKYPASGSMSLKMAFKSPFILASIYSEHKRLKKLVGQTGAKIVVSDNRFGLWTNQAYCIFITHQIFIKTPNTFKWLEPVLFRLNNYFITKYDQCWVPDFPGKDNISGELSHKRPLDRIVFTGPLTRFSSLLAKSPGDDQAQTIIPEFYLAVLSGPEPQRSILEAELIRQIDKQKLPVIFIRGVMGKDTIPDAPTRLMLNNATSREMMHFIRHSKMVICRPGYSTIMDLSVFGKKALVIPTPGQTEQLYLGDLLQHKAMAYCVNQHEIDLKKDIQKALSSKGISCMNSGEDLLGKAFEAMLAELEDKQDRVIVEGTENDKICSSNSNVIKNILLFPALFETFTQLFKFPGCCK